jgi:hypothetical protein
MIKLNKTQIDAITGKIYKELADECYSRDKVIKEEAVVKFLKTDVGKAITKINSAFFSQQPLSEYTIVNLALEYFDINFTKLPNKYDISNDIIVACIESPDLNSLIETIKAKHNV